MIFNIDDKKSKSLFLSGIKINASWAAFLTNEIIDELKSIENKLAEISNSDFTSITPDAAKVLRFLSVPVDKIKIVVLGQDPYPQAGVATGRAFEVGNLKSWSETYRNPSLKNIIRAIYKAYSGKIKTYKMIKEELGQAFKILPPAKAFQSWEKQGVLFLNTAFTCTIDASNSHSKIWQSFSSRLFSFIDEHAPDAIWFIWGNNAQEISSGLKLKNTIFSYHPSRCNPREKDFLYGNVNCFA
ncbi:MAG: uracil-DNA glycosylase, partial [Bacteroidota bacterium]|nr:uracil-DNA glycosylase [Bacteroidota bacterium]